MSRSCVRRRVVESFVLASTVATMAAAQTRQDSTHQSQAPYRGRLLGVYDAMSGDPLTDVDVTDMLTGISAKTTKTGTVTLSFLADGGSLVSIKKPGYAAHTMAISLGPADTAPITLVLERVQSLPAVVTKDSMSHYISAALRGFDERRRAGGPGTFIDEATLRKEENRRLSEVLTAHAPDVAIKQNSSATFLVRSLRCMYGQQPDVYVDGVPIAHVPDPRWPPSLKATDPSGTPIDLAQFQVSNLAGVEFYPDNAMLPVQFNHTSRGCGALLLWTREK